MSDEAKRFVVVEGSHSGHCCFDATVIDTTREGFCETIVCECFTDKDARMVADLLNASVAHENSRPE